MNNNVNYTVTAQDLISGKLQGMNANAQALEGTMGSLGNVIAGAFSVYAISSFVSGVVKAGTTVENAMTGLSTLLGNTQEAGLVVKNTMEDAQKTPFAFEGLLSANKALISAGINSDKARTDVLNLANAIAATGGGDDELGRMVVNMQQISNSGKATAQDIKQFAFAGINIYKVLSEATGQPIAKVKEMGVSYDMLTMALEKAHEKGGIYYNGLENMAQNTSVRISNVGDALFQFMNEMFLEFKPIIDGFLNASLSLISGLKNAFNFIKEYKNEIGFLIGMIAAYKTGVIASIFWEKIKLQIAYQQILANIGNTGSTITLTTAQGLAAVATSLWSGAMLSLNAAMTANPIGLWVAGIAALTAGVVYCYKKFETFRGVIWAVWGTIKEWFNLMVETFTALKDIIVGVFTLDLNQIEKGFNKATELALTAGQRIGKATADGYNDGVKDFKSETLLEQAQKGVAEINKRVENGTLKTLQEYNDKVAVFTKNLDSKVSQGLMDKATEKKTLAGLRGFNKKLGGGSGGDGTELGKPTTDKTKSVSGNKVVTINVTIGNLINDFQIKTTNIQESTKAIHDKVVQALTSAVNDSQLVAGQ